MVLEGHSDLSWGAQDDAGKGWGNWWELGLSDKIREETGDFPRYSGKEKAKKSEGQSCSLGIQGEEWFAGPHKHC